MQKRVTHIAHQSFGSRSFLTTETSLVIFDDEDSIGSSQKIDKSSIEQVLHKLRFFVVAIFGVN